MIFVRPTSFRLVIPTGPLSAVVAALVIISVQEPRSTLQDTPPSYLEEVYQLQLKPIPMYRAHLFRPLWPSLLFSPRRYANACIFC